MSKKDSGNKVYNIVAFIFAGDKRAQEVAGQAKLDARALGEKVISTATVAVDAHGKTHVHETGHGGRGAAIGAVTGGLLSLIGGPAGLLVWVVGGGVIGGIAGKHVGRAVPEADLKTLGQHMAPNTSALLLLLEDKDAEAVIDGMKGYNAKIVTLTVADQVSGAITEAIAADVTGPEEGKDTATPDAGKTGDQTAAATPDSSTPVAASTVKNGDQADAAKPDSSTPVAAGAGSETDKA